MNQGVLALLSVLAIYGLSSLALPQAAMDASDDTLDVQVDEAADASPTSAGEDEGAKRG